MDHTRHKDLYDLSWVTASIVGAGGIGAASALAMCKMGFLGIEIFDADEVGTENLTTQMHRISDVGNSKAFAVRDAMCIYSSDGVFIPHNILVTDQTVFETTFVVSAVDSISARKNIWKAIQQSKGVKYYLDARMSASVFHLYTVQMNSDFGWYEKMLARENDENVPDVPCTQKATIYTAFMAAGHIANAVQHIAMGGNPTEVLVHDIKRNQLLAGDAVH